MTRPRKTPIPLTIVAGLLGAGKTTLINRVLRDPAFASTAVILNEFGKTELENALVERAEEGIIALGGGCICCAVRGELVDALERLLRGLDNGRVASISRVIVESEASADPAAIFAAVARHPYLSLRFAPDAIVAVIRPDQIVGLAAHRDTLRQVAMGDVVAVGGISDEGSRQIAAINPFARIVDAAAVPPAALFGKSLPVDASAFAPETGVPGLNAFSVTRERAIPIDALSLLLDYLAALQGPNLIRLRAVVAINADESVEVSGIGGLFRPLQPAPPRRDSRFDVIAVNLDRRGFESYVDAFLNEARVDTPDRQALTENPLAIAGFSARSGR